MNDASRILLRAFETSLKHKYLTETSRSAALCEEAKQALVARIESLEEDNRLLRAEIRAIRPPPKDIICEMLKREGFQKKDISVRRGRGTSQSWIYITTPEAVHSDAKYLIEQRLVRSGLCGTYASDQPGLHHIREANVSWNVQ